ncbi:GGDEF domain-containing protein [Actinoplanes sp. NPDC089786]|uniref:GGDEF domain-containing protein n=1 Tax=Actinoplanes sp. NPDC089786 TaxID=3155185 RepID=UPI003432A355
MRRLRAWVPDTSLGRVRLVATGISVLGLAGQTTSIGGATGSPAWDHAGRIALLTLGAIVLSTYGRDRAWPWEPVVTPLLCVAAGSAMDGPVPVVGLTIAMLLVQSLYGSRRGWAVRSAGAILAVPAALWLSPSPAQDISFDAPGALSVIPQITLTTVIARMIYHALTTQQFLTARDAVLASAGAALLAASDGAAVHRAARDAAAELIALSPGTVVLLCAPDAGGVLVIGCVGPATDLTGQVLPERVLTEPATVLEGFADWHVEQLSGGRHRMIGHPRRVPPGMISAFRSLTRGVELSEATRRSHDELDRRANHDHLTQLPNRAKFFAELAVAVGRGPDGTIALLNIDLDDFKQVNDTFGQAAGDELLVRVAERLGAAAGDRGVAARFGGDEFALMLAGVRGPGEAEQVATDLGTRLSAPQRLATATVTVGASIGVAVHEPGVNAAALTRRARPRSCRA